MAKKKTTSSNGRSAEGKHLVIVESPTKAKTINKYLGSDYLVMASVGHVRDLPKRAPKGVKQPVPGVDIEHGFEPSYEVMPDKKKTVTELRKAAKAAREVWFATDLDREGEAIAWHLAQALGVPSDSAKRVVFNAITKGDISRAFQSPRAIDDGRVNAQQARRILDRIVGYQVSPLLWKKVAGGLSAGRVQSVATRVVVEREREIEAFTPEEYWKIAGAFAIDPDQAPDLSAQWHAFLNMEREKPVSQRERNRWLSENRCLPGELVEFKGQSFKADNVEAAQAAAEALGFLLEERTDKHDPKAKGPAQNLVTLRSKAYNGNPAPRFVIGSITTKRTSTHPGAPFITSTMQQAASNRLGFPLQRAMRVAQQLYEGIDLKEHGGQTGLITYMRTDSTHLSGEAIGMVRDYIGSELGEKYLPEKPQVYRSSNAAAQEAHEAIRPTDVSLTPRKIKKYLSDEQFKLYELIWQRFVSCQMTSAQWDSTSVLIHPEQDRDLATFKATGRTLVFDGFYKITGIPQGDDVILPPLEEQQPLAAIQVDPTQHFTSPPPRYTEASLQKKLESEGIGRPSTYAAIISTIQDRKYVEPVAPRDRRLRATDLGKVVTDMLVAAFPKIMDVAYTRKMESQLDQIEEHERDWVKMLEEFYGPFQDNLDKAYEGLQHAKAVTEPAPHECPKCGSPTVYRFGRKGRFLSCSTYPECKYAAPIDAEGNPMEPEMTDVLCPECGGRMTRRVGRFGPFLGCVNYPDCSGIVNLDRKQGTVVPPKIPPYTTDLPCPKCDAPLNLRNSKRGPWLSCSKFPKCRGRLGWTKLEPEQQTELEKKLEEHEKAHPQPTMKNVEGRVIREGYAPVIYGDNSGKDEDGLDDV